MRFCKLLVVQAGSRILVLRQVRILGGSYLQRRNFCLFEVYCIGICH